MGLGDYPVMGSNMESNSHVACRKKEPISLIYINCDYQQLGILSIIYLLINRKKSSENQLIFFLSQDSTNEIFQTIRYNFELY